MEAEDGEAEQTTCRSCRSRVGVLWCSWARRGGRAGFWFGKRVGMQFAGSPQPRASPATLTALFVCLVSAKSCRMGDLLALTGVGSVFGVGWVVNLVVSASIRPRRL